MTGVALTPSSRILVTGGTGLVGRALCRVLAEQGYENVSPIGSRDCDLRDRTAVCRTVRDSSPEFVFHLAARVHGIGGNAKFKSDILFDNVLINTHVIEESRRAGVRKIVVMGSGSVYPELKGLQE